MVEFDEKLLLPWQADHAIRNPPKPEMVSFCTTYSLWDRIKILFGVPVYFEYERSATIVHAPCSSVEQRTTRNFYVGLKGDVGPRILKASIPTNF